MLGTHHRVVTAVVEGGRACWAEMYGVGEAVNTKRALYLLLPGMISETAHLPCFLLVLVTASPRMFSWAFIEVDFVFGWVGSGWFVMAFVTAITKENIPCLIWADGNDLFFNYSQEMLYRE